MTYEEVIALGWQDRHPNSKSTSTRDFIFEAGEGFDYHIMSIGFGCGDDDTFDVVMINCVPEKTVCNVWENSETHFYGELKKKEELDLVMQFIGVTKYIQ